jgi:hypothetical protein
MIAVGSNLPPNVALGIDLPHRRQGADFALQQGDDVVLPFQKWPSLAPSQSSSGAIPSTRKTVPKTETAPGPLWPAVDFRQWIWVWGPLSTMFKDDNAENVLTEKAVPGRRRTMNSIFSVFQSSGKVSVSIRVSTPSSGRARSDLRWIINSREARIKDTELSMPTTKSNFVAISKENRPTADPVSRQAPELERINCAHWL